MLSTQAGQPGFTALSPTREPQTDTAAIVALDVEDADGARADQLRDAEAERVAELCSRLVGNFLITERDVSGNEAARPCQLGDIALLAAVGTDLWRFEQALEDRGLTVSTQAGKGFFRRQEIQDLIALARALADRRDTLAFGALLRGPLVGLTENELLSIADALPADPERPEVLPQLNLWTDPDQIAHDLARGVVRSLQAVATRARSSTPYTLLSDAVGLLNVRAQLRQRSRAGAERTLANVDVFLEMSRAYDVRGLRAFANDMRANWEEAARQVEGRPDAEEQSIALITIHAAKGLEWPVVIPINMTGAPKAESGLMHDRGTKRFSIPFLGVEPPDYTAIRDWNAEELARERVRLWYVAATRARDLLVLPRHSAALGDACYARIVDFDLPSLAAIDPIALGEPKPPPPAPTENRQTREIFAEEALLIALAHKRIEWRRPSRDEAMMADVRPPPVFGSAQAAEETEAGHEPMVAGGALRGTILHKLMEEILNGEIGDDPDSLVARAVELMAELGIRPSEPSSAGILPGELAQTIQRTLAIPEIAALRPRLVAEHTIFGREAGENAEVLVSGVADAVAYNSEGRIETVVDWKSDVEIDPPRLNSYRAQLEAYRSQTGAREALLVLMSKGRALVV